MTIKILLNCLIIKCILTFIIQSFVHFAVYNFVLKGAGQYKNFKSILKLLLGKTIFLYLFMNLIIAILLYKRANCFPIQLRLPALNPVITNGCKLSHSPFNHLSGLNLRGSLKYFYE